MRLPPALTLAAAIACGALRGEPAAALSGGRAVTGASALWRSVVAIDMDPGDYTAVMPCTGVLIGPHLALTAAHCARPAAGGRLLSVSLFDPSGAIRARLRVAAEWVQVHPRYRDDGWLDDVALVPFSGELPQDYRSVALLADEGALSAEQALEIAGVGLTETGVPDGLRSAFVSVARSFPDQGLFSAADAGEKVVACTGDSGGPALLAQDGTLVVAGLVSYSVAPRERPCAGVGTTYLSSIPRFKAWIEETKARLAASGF